MTLSKEKIFICDSNLDYRRYKDSLVKSNAKNSFIGEKSISFLELALEVVLRYQIENGKSEMPSIVNERDVITVMYFVALQLIEDSELTFFKNSMFSYSLIGEIRRITKLVREENAYEKFVEINTPKIRDVLKIVETADIFFVSRGEKDGVVYFSEEQLYKKAIEILKENSVYIDRGVDYEYLGNGEISAIQKKLLSFYVENCDVKTEKTKNVEELIKGYSSTTVQRSYGNYNEIYGVISDITKNKYNLSDVMVLLSSSTEINNVLSSLESLEIPYKCSAKISAECSEIYYILEALFDIKPDFISEEIAYSIIKKTSVSEDYIGFLISVRNDKSVSAREFVSKTAMFVKEYFAPPNSENIFEILNEQILFIPQDKVFSHERAREFVLNTIKTMSCSFGGEENESGILLGTLSSRTDEVRPHLYILGMDSISHGIQKSESPIMSDDKLKSIGVSNTDFNMLSLSRERYERLLSELVYESSHLIKASIFISYVDYDSNAMINKNPSSFVMKLKKLSNVKETSVSFCDKLINSDHLIALKDNFNSCKDVERELINPYPIKLSELRLSATSVKLFLECQRKFYYSSVLKIKPEKEVEVKPDTWLEKNVQGDFVHEALKEYVESSFVRGVVKNLVPNKQKMQIVIEAHKTINEELLNNIIDRLDRTYSTLYPALREAHTYELGMLVNAIRNELGHIIKNLSLSYPVATEWTSDTLLEIDGMKFSKNSRIDRIDYNVKDNSYTIIDYKVKGTKTSRSFKTEHDGNQDIDKNNNVQEYLYYLIVNEYLKTHGRDERVNAFIFRLVMISDKVVINDLIYSENIIRNKVEKIKYAYDNKTWECTEENSKCSYCDYKKICKDLICDKNNKGEEREDE